MSYEFGHCRADELLDLVDLANRVFRAGRAGDMGEEYPLVFEAQNVRNLRVARADGRIVGHVGVSLRNATILGAGLRVASIGAVATDPEHRKHGIASQLMADARREAVEQGASLMLISGGRGLYHRLGYVQVGSFQSYGVPAGAPDPDLYVAPFEPDDLAAVIRLHQAEPVRFFRPMGDWHKVVAAGMLMNQQADLFVIRQGNAIVAYAGVQRPVPDPSGALRPARVREMGGSRTALAASLPGIAKEYGTASADVVTWLSDAEWRSQALLRGWSWSPVSFPGTLGIIDPARFFAAVQPLFEERSAEPIRVEPAGEGVRITAGRECVELASMGQVTALVFGGHTEEALAVPELPDRLRAALDRVLPLPLLWYGYNYV